MQSTTAFLILFVVIVLFYTLGDFIIFFITQDTNFRRSLSIIWGIMVIFLFLMIGFTIIGTLLTIQEIEQERIERSN